uniref:DUF4371 domain-containing protein n=1 Tax=Strongyloides venezuelensis TaxID=75913 RepID=A0A0K0FVK7_STRVS
MNDALIKYEKSCDNHLFHLEMTFYSVQDENLDVIPRYYKKTTNIQSGEEFSRFMNVFDINNLVSLFVLIVDSFDIFDILNRSSQIRVHIHCLKISKVAEKYFKSFIIFIEKFLSVEVLYIEHICSTSTEMKDAYLFLFLSSLYNINSFAISECCETKVLTIDMIVKLIEKNPEIGSMDIG